MTKKNDTRKSQFSLCLLIMLNVKCYASDEQLLMNGNTQLEDFNGNFVDHETKQGSFWRTIGYEEQNDPKKLFFLRMELNDKNSAESSTEHVPKGNDERSKRQTGEQNIDVGTENADIEEELSTQQQELDTLDTLQVFTETVPSTPKMGIEDNYFKNKFIPINDFIRFRRQLIQEAQERILDVDKGPNSMGKTQNFDLDNGNIDGKNNRGTRGLSKQEWVKFPYQVQRKISSEDSFASSSDFSKPRRVHFITQKQIEVEDPLEASSPRQGRVADRSRQSRGQSGEQRDVRKGEKLFTPRFRDFNGPSEYPSIPYSRGRYYDRDLIENGRPDFRSFEIYPRYRDRRIIYYANLPEISRNSPRVREMERYRDPFYNKYSGDLYQRSFYRDNRNEGMHPMKVYADINVREVKKNPEKRIYSDVQRKYGHDIPSLDANQATRH